MKKQFLIKIFLICIFLFSIQIANAQNLQFQGNIINDTTWAADTLEITGDVIIDSNVTLIVMPGTFVHILGYYSIWSYGAIRAIGTETDTIVFTHLDTIMHNDTSTIEGGWHGIRLLPRLSGDTTIFKYCKIANGKAVVPGSSIHSHDKPDNMGGNLYAVDFGNMIIENSYIVNGRVRTRGGGIYMKGGNFVQIDYCHFKYNHTYYDFGGGAYILEVDTLYVRNSLFNYNTAFHLVQGWAGGEGGGIAISHPLSYTSYALIKNNRFFNNKTIGGVLYDAYYNADIIGNVICNNYGMALWNAHYFNYPVYTNNIIVNNVRVAYSGVSIKSPNAILINNIIWRNLAYPHYPTDQILYDGTTSPEVKYCNVMYGYEGEGNINAEPLFVNPTPDIGPDYDALNADWSLLDNSPCINTGTPDTTGLNLPEFDIIDNPRIYGNRIDMGAYENQYVWVKINDSPVFNKSVKVYPNPGKENLFVELQPGMEGAWLDLVDGTGKCLIHSQITTIPVMFSPIGLKTGIYYYRIYNHEQIFKKGKWVKM
jgi:hypothetical protein